MKHIAAYLNDHLAGSVAAVELLNHLVTTLEGTPHARFFESLREEIKEDQEELQRVVSTLSGESIARKALGWMAEKLAQWKIAGDGEKLGELGLLEALEMLALGITGKRMLWDAMGSSKIGLIDNGKLSQLRRNAESQFQKVESARLAAAGALFGSKVDPL
jgi:hypothetical protein